MKKKQILCLLLSLILLIQQFPIGVIATGFTDLNTEAWYNDSVEYVYDNGLMNGLSATSFGPDNKLTRAMFVTILGRMEGVKDSDYITSDYSDVEQGIWYSGYVAWASETGIVNGYGNGKFGTNDNVTREQMATMIARYLDSQGLELPDAQDAVSGFRDASDVSGWAKDGLELMRRTGLLKGDTSGNFRPKDNSTRAEAAALFMRLHRAIVESRIIPEGAIDLGGGDSMYQIADENVEFDSEEMITYVNDILVAFVENGLSWKEKEELAASVGGSIAGDIDGIINILQIRVPAANLSKLESLCGKLMKDDRVNYASFEAAIPADSVETNTNTAQAANVQTWWYDLLEAEYVQKNYRNYLEPVKVGVIDAGIDNHHNEFENKVSFASSHFEEYNDQMLQSLDTNPNLDTIRNLDHGTHVAGIIAARDNNTGITGITPDSDVVFASFQVAPNPLWTTSVARIQAINEMVEQNVKVINCSFGMTYFDEATFERKRTEAASTYGHLETYSDYLSWHNQIGLSGTRQIAAAMCALISADKDFLIIHSAGNGLNGEGQYGLTAFSAYNWAAINEMNCRDEYEQYGVTFAELEKHFLVVTSITDSMTGEYYDLDLGFNYGETVDICAPGRRVYSSICDNTYGERDGTSMAAPMVSGVAALVWSVNPDMKAEEVYDIVKGNYRYEARGTYLGETWTYPVVNARLAVEAAIDTVLNNGKKAVRNGDDYYYWTFSGTGENPRYALIKENEKAQTKTLLSNAYENSEIYIVNDQIWVNQRGADYSDIWALCIDSSGKEMKRIPGVEVVGVDENAGFLILSCVYPSGSYSKGNHIYFPETGKSAAIPDVGTYNAFVAASNGYAYFQKNTSDSKGVSLMQYNPKTGAMKKLATSYADYGSGTPGYGYMPCELFNFQETEFALYYSYGFLGGTGMYFQNGGITRVDKQTGRVSNVISSSTSSCVGEDFYVYTVSGEEYIICTYPETGTIQVDVKTGSVEVLDQQNAGCLMEAFSVWDSSTKKQSHWIYPEEDGVCVQVLPPMVTWEGEKYIKIKNINYLGDCVYFEKDTQVRNPNMTSWRDEYTTSLLEAYIYDLGTGQMRLLCSIKYDV